MRLAWFSPMPPIRSGVATVSADLVAALGAEHQIDVFTDRPIGRVTESTRSVHEFVWLNRRRPYDLAVYQLGNSSHHHFEWPYVFRYPGLTVLHDAHLHHARAACLLQEEREDDYRAELIANHPEAPEAVSELAVAGFDNHIYYRWPMTRLVVRASRLTAVHAPLLADALRREAPGSAVEAIHLGHGTLLSPSFVREARARVRGERGIRPDAVVFGIFGGLTPEKRVPQALEAFAAVRPHLPSAHLLLAGGTTSYYDVAADVRARGLDSHVTVTGYLPDDDELSAHIATADVALMLRWPTAREVSGPWLRALAAGIPTVVTDLAHLSDVPTLSASCLGSAAVPNPESQVPSPEPVSVAVDIADEPRSLRLALRRLATDAALRHRIGTAGQRYWIGAHSPEVMAADYRRIIEQATARPAPRASLPPHLMACGDARLRAILDVFDDETVTRRLSSLTGAP